MNNPKRHNLVLALLQAGLFQAAESCSPNQKILYFNYAALQVNRKLENKKSRRNPFAIFFMLQKFFILLLPLVVMANNEEVLLNEVATTSTTFIELRKIYRTQRTHAMYA